MKRFFALLVVSFLFVTGVAFAHSGGTDANGCHIDHKTGIRH